MTTETEKPVRKKTRSDLVAGDVLALMRARTPLIWVVTREEARVEGYLMQAALALKYVPRTWDVGQGVCGIDGKVDAQLGGRGPDETLAMIRERALSTSPAVDRGAWIMRDLGPWLEGAAGAAVTRQVRNLARMLPSIAPASQNAQTLIVIGPSAKMPEELLGHATVVEWPLPDRDEIEGILNAYLGTLDSEKRGRAEPRNGARAAAVDAAVGLTGTEAAACYARSLVQLGVIDPVVVASEKKRVIAREGVLEWIEPLAGGLEAVGGLENLKGWIVSRKAAYSPAARAYGLPRPKGAVFVGVPGCGKSLTSKAVPTAWGVPLLKMDLGAMRSKFVGDSEATIRKALRVVDAIGRCVLWVDEVEKGLQGATSGSADGGVSADALGVLLSWMQDRTGDAFVVMTANDVAGLPPELLRKGRVDDVWFVDLPTAVEREGVLTAALRAHGRGGLPIDKGVVSRSCDGFTGAEVSEIVADAMFVGFADGAREITTDDLVAAARRVVPLSRTAAEKIAGMRKWAQERARFASVGSAGAPRQIEVAATQLDMS